MQLDLTGKVAATTTYNKYLQEQLAAQKKEVVQIEEKLAIQFKNLANDILEEKSKKFTKRK